MFLLLRFTIPHSQSSDSFCWKTVLSQVAWSNNYMGVHTMSRHALFATDCKTSLVATYTTYHVLYSQQLTYNSFFYNVNHTNHCLHLCTGWMTPVVVTLTGCTLQAWMWMCNTDTHAQYVHTYLRIFSWYRWLINCEPHWMFKDAFEIYTVRKFKYSKWLHIFCCLQHR